MKTKIEQRFDHAVGLAQMRNDFVRRVVRWAYSQTEIWSWFKTRQWRTDDELQGSPEGAFYACGYDAQDQPIVLYYFDTKTEHQPASRSLREIPLAAAWCEEFISHEGDTLEVFRYVRGKLERITKQTYQGWRLIEGESVIQGFYQHTLIHYKGSKKALQQSLNNKGQVFHEIEFGQHGQHSYFRVRRDGSRFPLYQPLPKGITVKSLKETVRDRLVLLIPKLVSAADIREAIFCVALAYDEEGNDALPPVIGIGLESERQQWRAEHGKKAKDYIWNPAHFYHYEKTHTQLSDDSLEDACDYLNSKWAERDSSSAAATLLLETAVALTHAVWPASVQRTQDFVVYAVGFEGGGLRKSLKSSLSAEALAQFKAQGMI